MGIEYFYERIVPNGFPKGSMILISGEPGTGKTIFSSAIAFHELKKGKKVLYISFNETKEDFMRTISKFGWKFDENFKYVDLFAVGKDALNAQMKLIIEEFLKFKPDLLVIDSITALTSLIGHEYVRSFLHTSLGTLIKKNQAVALLIAEKPFGVESLGVGVEEFVVDGVIILRFLKYGEHYRRVLEIPKMRRRKIEKPQYEYTITENGITFFDVPELKRKEEVVMEKVTTGIDILDALMDGGVYRGSVTVIAGQTGTGKTTFGLHFTYANALRGYKSLFVTFEESVENILKAMSNYGMDYDLVKDRMRIEAIVPESCSPVSIFIKLKDIIEHERPIAMFIDSFSAIEENMNKDELKKMIRYLQLTVKSLKIATMMTVNVDFNNVFPTTGLSTLADNMIILKYDFNGNELSRKLLILKSRSSNHSRKIHRFDITSKGVVIL